MYHLEYKNAITVIRTQHGYNYIIGITTNGK